MERRRADDYESLKRQADKVTSKPWSKLNFLKIVETPEWDEGRWENAESFYTTATWNYQSFHACNLSSFVAWLVWKLSVPMASQLHPSTPHFQRQFLPFRLVSFFPPSFSECMSKEPSLLLGLASRRPTTTPHIPSLGGKASLGILLFSYFYTWYLYQIPLQETISPQGKVT